MHAEMDAIDAILASLPDEDKDTAFHRQIQGPFPPFILPFYLQDLRLMLDTGPDAPLSTSRELRCSLLGFDCLPHIRRCQLYVTCEPCIMCAGALGLLHFERVHTSPWHCPMRWECHVDSC